MRSIIALPDDYVVVDLETTGTIPQGDEIIEISAIRYRNGVESARFDQLVAINRPIPVFVTMLTGITNEMLAGKPHIQDVLPAFAKFIGDDILIGHNIAAFDSCFLAKAYKDHLYRELENPCVDTLRISKKLIPKLPRHSLEMLASIYNISYSGAHRGMADCLITNGCYQKLKEMALANGTEEDFKNLFQKKSTKPNVNEIAPSCSDISQEHPLFNKVVVFTGAMAMTRAEAMQMAVDVGAVLKTSVTAKTDYLVVGTQDVDRVGLDGMSTKEEKAHALNESGKAHIQIITEDDFMRMARRQ